MSRFIRVTIDDGQSTTLLVNVDHIETVRNTDGGQGCIVIFCRGRSARVVESLKHFESVLQARAKP